MREELERVLASPIFAAAPRLQKFLRFIVEESLAGRAAELKEYVIAVQVFGRKSTFDPKLDSVVRVEGTNVRKRLREYYLFEGAADRVVIGLPRGGYRPVFRIAEHPPAVPAAARRGFAIVSGLAAALLLLAAGGAWWWTRDAPASLAVLPFANLDGSPQEDYIAGALVEELTTALARSPRLRVVARTSTSQFDKSRADIREIGRRLGAGAVVEGSVRRAGERLRVTVQLIEANGGYHLWSQAFEAAPGELGDLQERIAGGIRRTLLGRDEGASRALRNPSGPAVEEYWKGRYLLSRSGDRDRAVPHLREAARLEPAFAAAHSALALAYSTMAFHLEGPVEELATQARVSARRALELDPESAEALTAMAQVDYAIARDWTAAEREFRSALEVSASYSKSHTGYALMLMARGRFREARAQVELARRLDPLSHAVGNEMAVVLYCARQYEEAVEAARRSLDLKPDFVPAWSVTGLARAAQGRLGEARSALERSRDIGGMNPWLAARLAYVLGRLGDRDQARQLAAQVPDGRGLAISRSIAHLGLGERVDALEWLERAAARREADAVFLAVDPIWDPLRAEPRFRALQASLGL